MALGTLYIEERDVEADFGLIIEEISGLPGGLSGAPRDIPLIEGAELSGGRSDPRLVRRKRLSPPSVLGHIKQTTMALALAKLDALRNLLGGGEVRLRSVYAPDRYCLGLCETTEGAPANANVIDGQVAVKLLFTIPAGVAFLTNPDGYALTTARTACPMGTEDTPPMLLVHGNGATLQDPTITVRNAAGDVVQTMGFSTATLAGAVLGATSFLRIDCARTRISLSTAGVITDGMGLFTSGDFPLLRRYDGWYETSAWSTVELSAVAGTPVGEIHYTRRYL